MFNYNLVDPNKYTMILAPKVKPKKKTMIERKIRYQKQERKSHWL